MSTAIKRKPFFYDFKGDAPTSTESKGKAKAHFDISANDEKSMDLDISDSDHIIEALIKEAQKEIKDVNVDVKMDVPTVKRYWDPEDNDSAVVTCGLCGESGHTIKECSHEQVGFICGRIDSSHQARDCPVAKFLRPYMKGRPRCYKCGANHPPSVCPSLWRVYNTLNSVQVKSEAQIIKSCYNCAGDDHFGDNCPLPRGHPLKYGEPSAFNDFSLPHRFRSTAIAKSHWSQPPPSHPIRRKRDSFRRSPYPNHVPEEDDWFEKREKLSSKALSGDVRRRDITNNDRPSKSLLVRLSKKGNCGRSQDGYETGEEKQRWGPSLVNGGKRNREHEESGGWDPPRGKSRERYDIKRGRWADDDPSRGGRSEKVPRYRGKYY